eukprot:8868079-Pyramimonas_sp.AAC.1
MGLQVSGKYLLNAGAFSQAEGSSASGGGPNRQAGESRQAGGLLWTSASRVRDLTRCEGRSDPDPHSFIC